jgi:hypothetical protein
MKPAEERRALANLRYTVDTLQKINLLSVLGRDDERGRPDRGKDPVHKNAKALCKQLSELCTDVGIALNLAKYLEKNSEYATPTVPDCLACGELALPISKSGFCALCYVEWRAFQKARKGDRNDFMRIKRAAKDSNAG